MADMQSGCLSGVPESETAPKMPHTTAPFHPAGEVVEVGGGCEVRTARTPRSGRPRRGAAARRRGRRAPRGARRPSRTRSEEHTSELQSPCNLVCRLLLEKKKRDRT